MQEKVIMIISGDDAWDILVKTGDVFQVFFEKISFMCFIVNCDTSGSLLDAITICYVHDFKVYHILMDGKANNAYYSELLSNMGMYLVRTQLHVFRAETKCLIQF